MKCWATLMYHWPLVCKARPWTSHFFHHALGRCSTIWMHWTSCALPLAPSAHQLTKWCHFFQAGPNHLFPKHFFFKQVPTICFQTPSVWRAEHDIPDTLYWVPPIPFDATICPSSHLIFERNQARKVLHHGPKQKLIQPANLQLALHQANAFFIHVHSCSQAQARSDRCDHFRPVVGTAAVQPWQKWSCRLCQTKLLLTWMLLRRNQLHASNLQRHAMHNVLSLDLILVRDKNAPKVLDVMEGPPFFSFFLVFLGTSGTSSRTKTSGFTLAQPSSCFLWWLTSTLTLVLHS